MYKHFRYCYETSEVHPSLLFSFSSYEETEAVLILHRTGSFFPVSFLTFLIVSLMLKAHKKKKSHKTPWKRLILNHEATNGVGERFYTFLCKSV